MKAPLFLSLLPCALGIFFAQMPSSFDASGQSAQQQAGVQQDDSVRRGEQDAPQLLGMEIPLLDPASDTVSYNGGKFDVGNNAVVRARFEKYLQQVPDDTEQSRRYRARIADILKATQRSSKTKAQIGSEALVKIGTGLYEISDYPGDGGQAGALASAIVSALDVQRTNLNRDRKNEKLNEEIKELVKKTNSLNNRNTQRGGGGGQQGDIKAPNRSNDSTSNTFLIGKNTEQIAANEAKKVKNEAANEASILMSKINYQATLMALLMQRRFDHVVIGARTYRHLFKDGDTKLQLDKDSDASKMFMGIGGMPPTVNSMDTMASNARREVDQSIEAVHGLLAQNKLAEATQHLIEAMAIGEYMQSVATFPAKDRQRIARYWTLRKRALTALNARDYGTVEEIAGQMKAMDADFDDAMLLSYCTGKKRLSDLCIRNAMMAMKAGNQEEFNKQITEAGIIWPRNPNLDKGQEELARLDNNEPLKDEFRTLVNRKDFRTIYNERERFKVVAIDPELEKDYTAAVEHIARVDAMLAELANIAKQDKTIGPCMAYEKLVQMQREDALYAEDKAFSNAVRDYENDAHEFVKALKDGEESESRREYGSALSNFYRALCFYPNSSLAKEAVERVTEVIVKAQY